MVPDLAKKLETESLYLFEKSTRFLRFSVIAMLATITSYLRARRPGMMPSQSCAMISQSASIFAQSAFAMSTSQPTRSPLSSI